MNSSLALRTLNFGPSIARLGRVAKSQAEVEVTLIAFPQILLFHPHP